ncbi:hypothetical protein BGZ98_010403 [Dissophora globulifera]|nr:hypothetical protein BGZ98_010403 [Dissophora globulifera]
MASARHRHPSLPTLNDEMRGDGPRIQDLRNGETPRSTKSPLSETRSKMPAEIAIAATDGLSPSSSIPTTPRTPTTANPFSLRSSTHRTHSNGGLIPAAATTTSRDAERDEPESAGSGREGSFRAVYPYPENKDVIVWKSKDPKTARTTTISMLDTRANTDSNSIMSQTRRMMDQKLREKQRDIQRELSSSGHRVDHPTFSRSLSKKKEQDDGEEGSHRNDNDGDENDRKMEREVGADPSRKPSRGSNINTSSNGSHPPIEKSTSPLNSPTQRDLESFATGQSNRSRDSVSKRSSSSSSSRAQIQRVLSGKIFISNPRGVALTPSPDASLELAHTNPSKDGPSSSASGTLVTKDQQSMQAQERMQRYGTQLDGRIHIVQENNRRLLELKLLLEKQGGAMVIHGQDEYIDDDALDDQEDDDWIVERAQWEEANMLLEQSLALQQQLKDDLERERLLSKNKDIRIQELSDRVDAVNELNQTHTIERETMRQGSFDQISELERLLAEERRSKGALQLTMSASLTNKEKELVAEGSRQRASHQAEIRTYQLRVQELQDTLRRQEENANVATSKHVDQVTEVRVRIQELEHQLQQERSHQAEEQKARGRVQKRIEDLVLAGERKDDECNRLRNLLNEREEIMRKSQAELEDARSLLLTLEEQLVDLREDAEETRLREQDRFNNEIRQQKEELWESRQELMAERELTRELENRLEATRDMHESKAEQLKQELEKRTLQLSQTNSNSSSAATTIHQLQTQIHDQERALSEKEDRIQHLEDQIQSLDKELNLVQQQAQSELEDVERDISVLEKDRAQLDELLQRAHQQANEEHLKIDDLTMQLNRRHDQEQRLLERLLKELDTKEILDDQDGVRDGDFDNGDSSRDNDNTESNNNINDSSVYSRIQKMIRRLKQERLYQDEALSKYHQYKIHSQPEQEEKMRRLEEDCARADQEIQDLREKLQSQDFKLREDAQEGRGVSNGSVSRRAHHDPQRQYSQTQQQEMSETVKSLQLRIHGLKQEKQDLQEQLELMQDQIQTMDGTIQDQMEAARSISSKYVEKIDSLQEKCDKLQSEYDKVHREYVKSRKVVVKQEGSLILYLSVIEKLKLQLRGALVDGAPMAQPRGALMDGAPAIEPRS